MSTIPDTHIRVDDAGVAWVEETQVKVIEIALDKIAFGWTPDQMHEQHPNLSLAQIHAALAYYYDHQAELDLDIAKRYQMAKQMAAAAGDSPGRQRLRSQGKLP